MSKTALRLDHVWKKFSRGERHDSLRDLIPAVAKKFMGRGTPPALKEKEFWALHDVDFEIKQGEAVGIIGHNGAGKSTMLKHLSGIMTPTRGSITVNGRLSALIEVSAGFHQDLTGRENVFLNGAILGMSRAEIQRKFDEIVSFSGLEEFIDTPVKRYSSGMFARLGFSVAAHLEPDILVIDEVLSVGDHMFQTKGVERMKEVARSGATVIFVSHNLRAVADLCPRSILMSKGRLMADGPTPEVIVRYMEQINKNSEEKDKPVYIKSVVVRSPDGERLNYTTGDSTIVEISVKALRRTEKFSIGVHLLDEKYFQVFDTASERLGLGSVSLDEGQEITCRFELALHLVPGTYTVGATLYRFDINREYDRKEPAATLMVNGPQDVRGAANLYPRCELIRG